MKKTETLHTFFFSFSYKGVNQGCCNVQGVSEEEALQKTIDLDIHPKHDDIAVFLILEPEMELNRLFSKKEMEAMEYEKLD